MRFLWTIAISAGLLLGCQGPSAVGGDQDGRLYSYVDSQGNLVTLEKSASDTAKDSQKTNTTGTKGDVATPDKDKDEVYRTPEDVEKELEESQRDRFVSYVGPEGEVITQPLDLVAEKEAVARRQPEFEPVEPGQGYLETVSRVPANCCDKALELATELEVGNEKQLHFARATGWIRLRDSHPAVVIAPQRGVGRLVVRSFIHDDRYLAPRILFLDAAGLPVLKVDNVFSRRYPESWRRYGYLEGELLLEPEHAYIVFYLPYGSVDVDSGRVGRIDGAVVSEGGDVPTLSGELVVRAFANTRRRGTNSGGE